MERNYNVNLIADLLVLLFIDTKWTVACQAEPELHPKQVVASEVEELLCWLR